MTWHTSFGDRILEGVEAELYLTAMQVALDMIEMWAEESDEIYYPTGDRIFDGASIPQKTVLMHRCLQAMLDPNIPIPELTNVMEAAAYLPFAFLEDEIQYEIDCGKSESEFVEEAHFFRRLLLQAYEALILPRLLDPDVIAEWGPPDPLELTSTDLSQWKSVIDALSDRIFWDRDWQLTYHHPVLLDGLEERFSQLTGIEDEYITNRLPKVTPEEAEAAAFAIKRCGQSNTPD